MAFLGRTLLSKPSLSFISFSPLFSSRTFASKALSLPRSSPLLRLRPLLSLSETLRFPAELSGPRLRCFSTRPTTSSLNDPSPNWSNRPPKETILLDGCDFEHWLVVMEPPEPTATRDEIIDSYIKTLATILGSDEEAAKSIYSVSTKHYYAFGCIVSEELSYKIKALPRVRWVLPDSYLDVKNKDYGGEPFIDGKAVPYDPKYHEEWVHNNARANERSRRNDRPRNFDRSRNFERRRENMQNRDFQNRDGPPMPNQGFQSREGQNPMPQNAMPPRDMPPMPNRDFQNHDFNAMPPRDVPNMGGVPNSDAPPSTEYVNRDNRDFQGRDGPNRPNRDFGGMPNREMGGMPGRDYQNQMPNPQTSYMPSGPSYQGGSPGYQGGSAGYQRGGPGFQGGNPGYQGGGPGHEGDAPGNQGGSPSYQGGGSTYQGSGPRYQGRDMPGRDYQ